MYDLLSVQEPESTGMGLLHRSNSTKTTSTQSTLTRSNTFSSLWSRAGAKFGMTPSFASTNNLSSSNPVVSRKALSLRTDPKSPRGGKYVDGLREIRVKSSEEAKKVLRLGQINRRVFGTLANKQSSRSHAVFTVRLVRVRKGSNISEVRQPFVFMKCSLLILASRIRPPFTHPASPSSISPARNATRTLKILGRG